MSNLSVLIDQQKFVENWANKFETLTNMATSTRDGVTSIVAGIGQNFAALRINLEANSDALEQLDIYNQMWAKMFLCLLERIVALPSRSKLESDQDIKDKAKEDFQALIRECKLAVFEERKAYIEAMRAQAAKENTEENMAEQALRNAEQSLSTAGSEGSAIPDDAEIFGG